MYTNTKNIILILLLGTAGICFYYGFSVVSDEPREGVTLLPTSSSSGAIETASGKRIETVGNSGTDWGMTPFGSGKPLEEIPEETLKFQKPNTEWKTRTISGVTYVFGEGNPKEVGLSQTELENLRKKCGTESDPDNLGYLCKEADGYVSPDVEKYILAALSDPNWSDLIEICEENLRYTDGSNLKYEDVLLAAFLDIDNWITINQEGRKELNVFRTMDLELFLYHRSETWYKATEYPYVTIGSIVTDGTQKSFQNGYNCIDRYGKDIINNLSLSLMYYRTAQGGMIFPSNTNIIK